jgi:hypothetical protein
MSDITQPDPTEPPRKRWQRFIDWLAGGPPDPVKLQAARLKPWYARYGLSIVWFSMAAYGMIYPFVVERLNATPELDRMQTVQLRIMQAREGDPHFDMRWSDGTVQSMEWPVEVTFSRGNRVFYWNKAQRQALVGCLATAQVTAMRWTLTDRYRVWSLSCPAVGFEVNIDQTTNYLNKHARSLKSLLVGFLILFFSLGFVFFLREKRGVI